MVPLEIKNLKGKNQDVNVKIKRVMPAGKDKYDKYCKRIYLWKRIPKIKWSEFSKKADSGEFK